MLILNEMLTLVTSLIPALKSPIKTGTLKHSLCVRLWEAEAALRQSLD